MSWTKPKIEIREDEQVWITSTLYEMGRKPVRKPTKDQLTTQLRGTGENVKRKKFFGGESKDKGFEKDVSKPVEEFLKKNEALLKGDDVTLTTENLRDIFALRGTLVGAGAGYEERSGKGSSNKRDQRQRKTGAVDSRVAALDDLTGVTPKALAQFLVPMPDDTDSGFLAKPMSELLESDSTDVATRSKERLKNTKELVEITVNAMMGDDDELSEMLGGMVARQITNETQGVTDLKTAKGRFMRSNTAFSSAFGHVMEKHEETRTYIDDFLKDVVKRIPKGSIELDPSKAKGNSEQEKQVNAQKGVTEIVKVVDGILGRLIGNSLPGPVAAVVQQIAQGARRVGFDEREVAIAVGGVVALRMLAPPIAILATKLGPEAGRTATLVSKGFQNLSNGILAVKGDKEAWLEPLNTALRKWEGPWRDWMLEISAPDDEE